HHGARQASVFRGDLYSETCAVWPPRHDGPRAADRKGLERSARRYFEIGRWNHEGAGADRGWGAGRLSRLGNDGPGVSDFRTAFRRAAWWIRHGAEIPHPAQFHISAAPLETHGRSPGTGYGRAK